MNTKTRLVLIMFIALCIGTALWATLTRAAPGSVRLGAGAPPVISYQGEVQVSGTPYTGNGYFKFAVVNSAGTLTYWSNDGSSAGGSEPSAAIPLTVNKGLFSVLLGDTILTGMTQSLGAGVFNQPDRYLRVWFSSDDSTYSHLTPDTRIAAVPYALQAVEAVDADTVDGLHANQLQTHYNNMVVVAKSGGDFTSIQSAIDSITTAAVNNPYLVWVAPGVYSETVTMKPFVNLEGAGQKATILTSTISSSGWPPTVATLALASDTSLREITVGNSGHGTANTAILAGVGVTRTLVADVTARAQGHGINNSPFVLNGSGTGVVLQRVNALSENASGLDIGLLNLNGAATVLHSSTFIASGGEKAWGIFTMGSGSTLKAENITVLAENASNNNFGFYNYGGSAVILRNATVTGRGGMQTRGVENANSGASLTAQNVTALAENGSEDNYGLGNYDSATAVVRSCSFTARGGTNAYGISNEFNGVTLEADSVLALAVNAVTNNYGLHNFGDATATLYGGSYTGRFGDDAYGIYNSEMTTTLTAEGVTALGEDGSNNNHGLLNSNFAVATLHGGFFTGRGGQDAFGISNYPDGTVGADHLTVLAEEGYSNYGLYNSNATTYITLSVLLGETTIVNSEGTVFVRNSNLSGGPVSGTVTCVLVTRGVSISTDGSTCP